MALTTMDGTVFYCRKLRGKKNFQNIMNDEQLEKMMENGIFCVIIKGECKNFSLYNKC